MKDAHSKAAESHEAAAKFRDNEIDDRGLPNLTTEAISNAPPLPKFGRQLTAANAKSGKAAIFPRGSYQRESNVHSRNRQLLRFSDLCGSGYQFRKKQIRQ